MIFSYIVKLIAYLDYVLCLIRSNVYLKLENIVLANNTLSYVSHKSVKNWLKLR